MIFSGRLASLEDLQDDLRVSAFLFANSAEIRDKLLFSLGGGWENLPLDSLPKDVDINAVAIMETGSITPNTLLALAITIQDLAGNPVASESFEISVSEKTRSIMRQCRIINLHFRASQPGVWLFSGWTESRSRPAVIVALVTPIGLAVPLCGSASPDRSAGRR
ncbi:MAG: hypothetical protein MUE46_18755 [Xanthomonadales bacterium]|nr:hypothetical protein [Xanthomonadales bacterium]